MINGRPDNKMTTSFWQRVRNRSIKPMSASERDSQPGRQSLLHRVFQPAQQYNFCCRISKLLKLPIRVIDHPRCGRNGVPDPAQDRGAGSDGTGPSQPFNRPAPHCKPMSFAACPHTRIVARDFERGSVCASFFSRTRDFPTASRPASDALVLQSGKILGSGCGRSNNPALNLTLKIRRTASSLRSNGISPISTARFRLERKRS